MHDVPNYIPLDLPLERISIRLVYGFGGQDTTVCSELNTTVSGKRPIRDRDDTVLEQSVSVGFSVNVMVCDIEFE
ncbi:hypothetical protein HALDL1_01315 (plasmid) [Halobacterium sp. DL1]|nr:hypothetical protein HALDL1_01315 [Halobacterium sp. DL1]